MSGKVITFSDIFFFFIADSLLKRIIMLFVLTLKCQCLLCMLFFNNGLESLDEALFVLGTALNVEKNDA